MSSTCHTNVTSGVVTPGKPVDGQGGGEGHDVPGGCGGEEERAHGVSAVLHGHTSRCAAEGLEEGRVLVSALKAAVAGLVIGVGLGLLGAVFVVGIVWIRQRAVGRRGRHGSDVALILDVLLFLALALALGLPLSSAGRWAPWAVRWHYCACRHRKEKKHPTL
ncbi:hypothetical protein B0H14DRAFT_3132058 [Mycena olivaceomarginata]|nr:hypothetical protein B0H14DRAFT_3132058 [Mycena olivaceomarginata]